MLKIILYSESWYEGKKVELTSACDNLGDYGMNNTVSSIKVEGEPWNVYEQADYKGASYVLHPGNYATWTAWGGENDKISSVKPAPSITLYEHANFAGKQLHLNKGCNFLGYEGMNDVVSSAKVARGDWIVYDGGNYNGESHTLTPGDYPIWTDWGGTNDRMSSVRPA